MNKAIILDRDGTINFDRDYVHKIKDFEFIPKTFENLKRLQEKYLLFIYTNQSGIGRGYYSEKDFLILNNHMLEDLKRRDIKISEVLYCPHTPKDNCDCRKPKTGLLERVIEKYSINRNLSYIIGDRDSDVKFGENAGIKTILIKKDGGLSAAVGIILGNEKK